MNSPIRQVVVAGGGIVAWWAAVLLKQLIPGLQIVLLNTSAEDEYAEVANSDLLYLLQLVGLSEQQLILHADGNFHSARAYFGWHLPNQYYFHANEVPELSCGIVDFNQWLLKLRQAGVPVKVDDYLLSAVGARQGKLVPLASHKVQAIGCSFDLVAVRDILKNYALNLGVEIIQQEIKSVTLDAHGAIASLTTMDDMVLQGDFYVDATGTSASLIRAIPSAMFESWQEFFPCDSRKILVTAPRSERLIPFSSVQMGAYGWIKNTPLRNKVVSEFVYSQDIDINQYLSDPMVNAFKHCSERTFTIGYRPEPWINNCLALGGAAMTLDHISHSEFHMAAVALKRFVDYWPAQSDVKSISSEFNRLWKIESEALRDFQCLHYFLAHNNGSDLSRKISGLRLPDSLAYRINLFKGCGRGIADEATIIHSQYWVYLFLGFEYWPESYDALAEGEPLNIYEKWSVEVRQRIHQQLIGLPEYTLYMNALLGASSTY